MDFETLWVSIKLVVWAWGMIAFGLFITAIVLAPFAILSWWLK